MVTHVDIYKNTHVQTHTWTGIDIGLNNAHPDFWSKREESFEQEPPARNVITIVC